VIHSDSIQWLVWPESTYVRVGARNVPTVTVTSPALAGSCGPCLVTARLGAPGPDSRSESGVRGTSARGTPSPMGLPFGLALRPRPDLNRQPSRRQRAAQPLSYRGLGEWCFTEVPHHPNLLHSVLRSAYFK
jgi:hypothetical protein